MPEESVVAYNYNVINFILFLAVGFLFLIVLLFLSKVLVQKTGEKANGKSNGKSGYPVYFRSDPYWLNNALILGLFFIFTIFFIFMITLALNFSQHPAIGGDLFLVLTLLFFLGVVLVYLVKSKILE